MTEPTPEAPTLTDVQGPTGGVVASKSADESVVDVPSSDCPPEMVLVAGEYCPSVRQTCKRWMDPPGPYQDYRCAEYAASVCLAPRVHERFCIDREEYVKPGDALPLAHQSWTTATAICESRGERLCKESEWQFACEGEEMLPYPYGLSRDSTACNIDQMNLGKPQAGLNDLRAPVTRVPTVLEPVRCARHERQRRRMGHAGSRPRARTVDDEGRVVAPGKEHVPRAHGQARRGLRGAAGRGSLLQGPLMRQPSTRERIASRTRRGTADGARLERAARAASRSLVYGGD